MSLNKIFWNADLMSSVSEYSEALEHAEEWFAEPQSRRAEMVDIDEVRPPSHELDLIPEHLAERLIEDVQYWLDCDDDLYCDDIGGRPTAPDCIEKLQPETREKLLAFCEAVLKEVDLSEAAWQSTGRSMRVWRDGKIEHLGGYNE